MTDPDGSTAINPLNLDGDETITINSPRSSVSIAQDVDYSIPLNASTKAVVTEVLTPMAAGASRNLQITTWTHTYAVTTGGSPGNRVQTLNLIGLGVGPLPASGSYDNAPTSKYVELFEFVADNPSLSSGARHAIGLLGTVTPDVNMPLSGTATYSGEAYGKYTSSNETVTRGGSVGSIYGTSLARDFTGSSILNVDFSKTTSAINGSITNIMCSGGPCNAQSGNNPTIPNFAITFLADLSGARFAGTAQAGVRFFDPNTGQASPQTIQGPIEGAFYGPATAAAAEAGATFTLTPSAGSGTLIQGGFVAKK